MHEGHTFQQEAKDLIRRFISDRSVEDLALYDKALELDRRPRFGEITKHDIVEAFTALAHIQGDRASPTTVTVFLYICAALMGMTTAGFRFLLCICSIVRLIDVTFLLALSDDLPTATSCAVISHFGIR